MSVALQLSGIHKSFDSFVALSDANFSVSRGEVHALLGENGAGKSTLMNVAAGLYRPEAGTLRVDGKPVHLGGPLDAARLGIGMVHQHFKLVSRFTVAENILLGAPVRHDTTRRYGTRLQQIREAILCQCKALGFELDPDRRVAQLSVAEQQRAEIVKVLVAGAHTLVLDEPTAVLTDQEAARLLETMRLLATRGAAVVLVTHKMADVRRYADRVTVMRAGRTLRTFAPNEVSEQELIRLAVGEAVPAEQPPAAPLAAGDPRLLLRGVRSAAPRQGKPLLDGIDLSVRAGQIYGIAGVGGNGQTELMLAIMGLLAFDDGSMTIDGTRMSSRAGPVDRRAMGIACIPADRASLALAGDLSVAENYAIGHAHEGRFGHPWWFDYRQMDSSAADAVQRFDVHGVRSIRQKVSLLSGGNAQKLVIAREFDRQPKLVLAHSPSRGLDVRASAQVHARLRAARDDGAAVLLISEDLDEVLALADRAGVMVRGRIVGDFSAPLDRQAIGQAMVGHA
ncbi:ABC transporter ATP-binding protein [Paraburkholderia antibiotica]|uniref:ABC transporter ATP-binding protein n=1 Tax=Paraburkholderia antibiotica TaxID=2728839 RepID=A0A7X9X7F7_9BURK|nr:ABC transporter ATP-binding protein [Paraburkholderia antibiotica]NML32352.1 ABC transporter ATP-binding protein [Paraburkholderia antibiotica]